MQVDEDFQPSRLSPIKSLAEVVVRSLDVRFTLNGRNGPIADRNTNVVHPLGGNLVEVILSDPSGPMLVQSARRLIGAEVLAESELIDCSLAVCKFLEDRGCDPRLMRISNADAILGVPPNRGLRTSSTNQPPKLTPRTLSDPYLNLTSRLSNDDLRY